jgi:G3E family GTPase
MQHEHAIPVTIISGYLGSGKTTLLNALLRGGHGRRMAVLVNDFGAINIDAALIASHAGDTIELTNGCVCCSLRDNLGITLYELAQRASGPDQIVIEASGVADPERIAHYAQSIPGLQLGGTITLVDVETIEARVKDKYVGEIVQQQMRVADLLVLSKVDLVSMEQVVAVRNWLSTEAPGVPMVEAVQGQAPLDVIFGVRREADAAVAGQVMAGAAPADVGPEQHGHADSFDQMSLVVDHPLNRAALIAALNDLPVAIIRAKGVLDLADEPARKTILQIVGGRWTLDIGEAWGSEQPQSRLTVIALKGQLDRDAITALAAY